MENPLRHFADLDLKRTFVAGCPCQTKTAASMAERPAWHNPHGNLPPRTRYMLAAVAPMNTKTGEGVTIPSKIWTDADVEKERSASAWKGIALGATAGLLVGWWVL